MNRLFVGYDREQPLASAVCAHSAQRRCSEPLSVTFLNLEQLRGIHKRERDPLQTTEFAFTRFLVPYLCDYEGSALFIDGDMLVLGDLAELFAMRDGRKCVQVVKHSQEKMAGRLTKFLGRPQTPYQRKNWSSVTLFNNSRCRRLTPEYVDTAKGLDLHQFLWTRSDDIGELPPLWNHLVSIDSPNPGAKIVHYTLGMPTVRGGNECEYADEWRDELRDMQKHVSLNIDMIYAMRAA